MGEWLMAFFGFSQFKTFWNWIGLAADLFGIVALAITIWQIMQVKSKVNSSIDAMNELKRLQEQELLKKIFKELEGQQENLNWLLEKHGQSGYRGTIFEEKNAVIVTTLTHCVNELPIKYKEISDPIRSTVLELRSYNGEGKNITMNPHNSTKGAGGAFGFWVHGYDDGGLISNDAYATINVGSISIDTRNYAGSSITGDRLSVGLLAGAENIYGVWQGAADKKSTIDLNATNGVTISALTRNGANSYGIYSKVNGDVNVDTINGDIVINASKGLSSFKYDDGILIHKYYIQDADYANSQAYGLNAENGKITLSADNNISISAFIKDDSDLSGYENYEKYNDALQESDIYAVSNINGTIDLSTGNESKNGGIIRLSATANKGNAYGLYTKNGVKNSINNAAKFIITAKSTDGKAFGIYADNDKNNEYNNLTN